MNAYILGILCGVLVGVIVIAAIKLRRPNAGKYDERQQISRGKAYHAGFFTVLIAGLSCNLWDLVCPLPGESFVWNIGTLLLGVAVFAVTAIHHDAYLGLFDNPKRFLLGGFCFILAMSLNAILGLHSDRPFQRSLGILSLEVGLVWAVIVAALLLHRRNAQKEEE